MVYHRSLFYHYYIYKYNIHIHILIDCFIVIVSEDKVMKIVQIISVCMSVCVCV